MTDHDRLHRRLRRLGSEPPAPSTRAGHLQAMHAATAEAASRRVGRLAVAGAAIAGFVLGSTGFAMAGALPSPAQGMAHDVLSVVQVDVPDRPANRGACVSEAAKAATPEAKADAKAACAQIPPPGRSGKAPGLGRADERGSDGDRADDRRPGGHPDADTSDCKGKPPWAGTRGGPTAAQREELRARCPGRADEDEDEVGEDPDEADAADREADGTGRDAPAVPGGAPAPEAGAVPGPPAGAPPIDSAPSVGGPVAPGTEDDPADDPPADVPPAPPVAPGDLAPGDG